MTLATKSGAIILKDGLIATNCNCCDVICCLPAGSTPQVVFTYTYTRLSSPILFPSFTQSLDSWPVGSNPYPLWDGLRVPFNSFGDRADDFSAGSFEDPFTTLSESHVLPHFPNLDFPSECPSSTNARGSGLRPTIVGGGATSGGIPQTVPTVVYVQDDAINASIGLIPAFNNFPCRLQVGLPLPATGGGVSVTGGTLSGNTFAWNYAGKTTYTATFYWHNYTRLAVDFGCTLCCQFLTRQSFASGDFAYAVTESATPPTVSCHAYNGFTVKTEVSVAL
jgi:hypothetical protein